MEPPGGVSDPHLGVSEVIIELEVTKGRQLKVAFRDREHHEIG